MPTFGLPALPSFGQGFGGAPAPFQPLQIQMPAPPRMPSPPQAPRINPPAGAGGGMTDPFGGMYGQPDPGASALQPYMRSMIMDKLVGGLLGSLPPLPGLPAPPGSGAPATAGAGPGGGAGTPPSTAPTAPSATPTPTANTSIATSAPSTVDATSPSTFVKSVLPAAQQASRETGLPVNLLMAISAHETGWGKSMPGNEMMGIKGTGPVGSVNTPTQEWVNGQYVNTTADWKSYATPEQALADFKNFLVTNPRYSDALAYWDQTKDPVGLLQRINQAGYATNPNWWSEVASMMQNDIPRYVNQAQ